MLLYEVMTVRCSGPDPKPGSRAWRWSAAIYRAAPVKVTKTHKGRPVGHPKGTLTYRHLKSGIGDLHFDGHDKTKAYKEFEQTVKEYAQANGMYFFSKVRQNDLIKDLHKMVVQRLTK